VAGMRGFLSERQREQEWMDEPAVDPLELRRSLIFIRRINRVLGYTRVTLGYFRRFSRGWSAGQKISILDVATGSGDIPRAIGKWARGNDLDMKLTAVDLHAQTAQMAAEGNGLEMVRADARLLPFADKSFDYVTTAMFLHHLDEADVVRVLGEMNRVARRGVVVSDLLRRRRAYAWITLLTLFSGKMVRHDARVSVAQAFTKREMLEMSVKAGMGYVQFREHFGHRFVLAGEK
jgi:ubiquinone/menaquinone biosynthesis C-methylase UbiE